MASKRLRIAVVSPVFPPEPVVSSRTSAELVSEMAAAGHAVSVITAFPNRPAGRIYPGFSRRAFQRERTQNGVEIIRCFTFCSRHSTLASRFAENISFGVMSSLALLFMPRPDLVYSVTWPIFASALLAIVSRVRRIPVVSSVQDVYPESMIAQGRVRPGGLASRCLRALDRWCVSASRAVIVLSEYARRCYVHDRGLAAERVIKVPNWMSPSAVTPDPDAGQAFRRGFRLPGGAVLAVFGGNIGAAAGVELLIEAIDRANDPRLFLLIAGEGSSLNACRALVTHKQTARVLFHCPWPERETSMVLSSADLLLLPTSGLQSLASTPSKLLAYMLAAKPVLATAVPGSDLACIIEEAECGWVVDSQDAQALARKLREVASLPAEELSRRGQAGRKYVQRNLSPATCVPRLLSVLTRCAASAAGAPDPPTRMENVSGRSISGPQDLPSSNCCTQRIR